jgi:hypothetical protein
MLETVGRSNLRDHGELTAPASDFVETLDWIPQRARGFG